MSDEESKNPYLAWRRGLKLGQPEPTNAEEARQEMEQLLRLPTEGIEVAEVDTEAGFMMLEVGGFVIKTGFPLMPTGEPEACADEVISDLYSKSEDDIPDLPF